MRDLVSWHGGTFKSRHDSFCPIKTGVASDFCETWPFRFWGPPDKYLGAVSGKSDSEEKKNGPYPANRESLFESDHADQALASI
jgi:hypothetical protein